MTYSLKQKKVISHKMWPFVMVHLMPFWKVALAESRWFSFLQLQASQSTSSFKPGSELEMKTAGDHFLKSIRKVR